MTRQAGRWLTMFFSIAFKNSLVTGTRTCKFQRQQKTYISTISLLPLFSQAFHNNIHIYIPQNLHIWNPTKESLRTSHKVGSEFHCWRRIQSFLYLSTKDVLAYLMLWGSPKALNHSLVPSVSALLSQSSNKFRTFLAPINKFLWTITNFFSFVLDKRNTKLTEEMGNKRGENERESFFLIWLKQ